MTTWVGMPPGMPVTVATPPAPGVSVGPGPVDAVVVPESWMHIVPDFSAAMFTAAATLAAVTGVEALPGFTGEVVLGATVTTISELVAAATAVATATGSVAVPIPAAAVCVGTLSAATSTAAAAMFGADGTLAAAMYAAGTIPAQFGTAGTLQADVDKAGFSARFSGGGTLSALVAQGDRANASFAATGSLAAQVLVLFVRDATYQAAAQLTATQAVEPRDGGTFDATLTAHTTAIATTPANYTANAVLAVSVDDYQLNFIDTRVDKSASQVADRAVWAPVTWQSSTGDPVVADAIVISGAGQATIAGTITHGSNTAPATVHHWRIMINAVIVVEFVSSTYSTSTVIPATAFSFSAGDQIRLEVKPQASSAAGRSVSAGTFMTITSAT